MNTTNLTRKEKEQLYKEKMIKLQLHWGNPIDDDWDFSDWTDEQLDRGLEQTIGQLKFEMFWSKVGWLIKAAILSFIILGIAGLLTFGIKQIF